MRRTTTALRAARCSVLIVALVAVSASFSHAHHSIAGQFDMTKTVRLTGVVAKVAWANPHVYLHFEGKDSAGNAATWKLETLPVAMLRKAGISKQMLMSADVVALDVCPARDGTSHLGFVLNIQFPDGRRFQFQRDPNAPATVSQ
jgi:hypothetical protein